MQAFSVSLLFPAGERPSVADIRTLASESEHYAISIDPPRENEVDEGWVELFANGLTFDLTGLAPQGASDMLLCRHSFGLPDDFRGRELEAITLMPGPHLAGGGAMFPVVRSLALLAAHLTRLGNAQAVAWHPASALSEPSYFHRGVLGWIKGGAFPGLGLTALVSNPDGSLHSEGLALFTGQELLIPAEAAEDTSDAAKIALRLLDWLVEHGKIEQEFRLTAPSGELITLEPVEHTKVIRVWRGVG